MTGRDRRTHERPRANAAGGWVPFPAEVVTVPAAANKIVLVTEAYRRKYGRSPYLNGVVKPESLSGTLHLDPR